MHIGPVNARQLLHPCPHLIRDSVRLKERDVAVHVDVQVSHQIRADVFRDDLVHKGDALNDLRGLDDRREQLRWGAAS